MFARSVRVKSSAPMAHSSQALDGVIEVALDSFLTSSIGGGKVTVTYQVIIYGRVGQMIASWPIIGVGEEKYFHELYQTFGLETEMAIRSAAANFIVDFYGKPEVVRWIESANIS